MLRDKSLIPLSRQHQHALALCVRLSRALGADDVAVEAWQTEIAQQFELEVGFHFAAEEKEIFPRAAHFPELRELVQELLAEHEVLRVLFRRAAERGLDSLGLAEFAEKLTAHIRKEERYLFEAMQARISAEEMGAMGAALEHELSGSPQVCAAPNPATQLRTADRKG
jgi:hemerythrin-like domain-containing protein